MGTITNIPVAKLAVQKRLLAHGIIMWVAWFVIGFVQIGLMRWFFDLSDKNTYVYSFFGWFIFAAMVWNISALEINRDNDVNPDNKAHYLVGWFMTLSMSVLVFFGL